MTPHRKLSFLPRCFFALLLLAALAPLQAQLHPGTKLTTTPTEPIKRDTNPRYFNYGGQTVLLVGISGETIPHLGLTGNYPNGTNPRSSYCVFNLLPGSATQRKFQECLDKMVADNLNVIRLWVGFNAKPTPVSVPNHQPFAYFDPATGPGCPNNPALAGWDLETKNTVFFNNLRGVISNAQSRGVIVEVTMFIPGSTTDSQGGPWWSANNCQRKGFKNIYNVPATEDAAIFFQADNSSNDPFTATNLDTNLDNQYMRAAQVRMMQWVVDELSSFHNVIFELANEADMSGTSLPAPPSPQPRFANLINWHQYMARRLYEYETGKPRHLISANVSVKGVIDALLTNPKIDLINSHYVKLVNGQPGVTEADRHSATKMLFVYNAYNNSGFPGLSNTAVWGFNETHITGLSAASNLSATRDSARAEAWQFLLDGGGQYDHLSYCWGNTAPLSTASLQGTCLTTNAEDPDSLAARQQLGYLSRFLGDLPLNGMHRSSGNQTSFWLNTPTRASDTSCAPGNYCWAAMEGGTRVAYIHHSALSASGGFRRYDPIKKSAASCPASCLTSCTGTCPANCYRETTLAVKNLGSFGTCTATFKAEWFTPDGTQKDGSGNLIPIPGTTATINVTGTGQQVTLPPSPCYQHDIALKVTQTGFCP